MTNPFTPSVRLRLVVLITSAVFVSACSAPTADNNVGFNPDEAALLRILPIETAQTICSTSAVTTQISTSGESAQPACGDRAKIPEYLWFSGNSQRVVIEYADNSVIVWDASTGHPLSSKLSVDELGPYDVWFSSDGRSLAINSPGPGPTYNNRPLSRLNLWIWADSSASFEHRAEFGFFAESVWFDPGSTQLGVVVDTNSNYDQEFDLFDPSTGEASARLAAPATPASGNMLPQLQFNAGKIVYDATSAQFIISSEGQYGYITWSPGHDPSSVNLDCITPGDVTRDGHFFACTSGPERIVTLWDTRKNTLVRRWPSDHQNDVQGVGPNDNAVFVAGDTELAVPSIRSNEGRWIDVYRVSDQSLSGSRRMDTSAEGYGAAPIWSYLGLILTNDYVSGRIGVFEQHKLVAFTA